MNRDAIKAAADALGRLEALEDALVVAAERVPHQSFPISFYEADEEGRNQDESGIKAFYPREHYITTLEYLIANERAFLESVGIEL